ALSGTATRAGILQAAAAALDHALHPTRLWVAAAESPVEETALSVVLQRGEQRFGCLALGPKRSGLPYTAEGRRLLEAVAAQVAVALDSARLHEALLAQQRRELESRSRGLLEGAEEERRRLAADLHDHVLPDLRHIAAEAERLRGHAGADDLAPA